MNATTKHPTLPELSDTRIDEMEDTLFARIAQERATDRRRSARRGRVWMIGGAAAAVVAVAAIIAPTVGGLVTGSSGADSVAVQPATDGGFTLLPESATIAEDLGAGGSAISGAESMEGGTAPDVARGAEQSTADRDIITTASASVTVDDVAEAAAAIGEAATADGGYVESMNVGTTGLVRPADPGTGIAYDSLVYPPMDGAWVSVRVPADTLSAFTTTLSEFGEVTSSSIQRQDVTDQTVDLDARISAAQASVDRLTELMAQAGDLSDLIAAESALSERQAALESLQQQREMLGDQVAMSSVTVSLSPVVETVQADPAGFADGLITGWNGLVATLNGIVVALGFLLPWLAVGAIAWLVIWLIVRGVRRRSAAKAAASASVEE